jgi:hypothetical protein
MSSKCYFCFCKLPRFEVHSLSCACDQCAHAILETCPSQNELEFWLLLQIYEDGHVPI